MLPSGTHEDAGGFLVAELNFEIRRQGLPYSIPRNCMLKPLAPRSGYLPDIAVIDRNKLRDELLWQKSSVIQNGATVPLVIEIVSTNWRDGAYPKGLASRRERRKQVPATAPHDYGHKFVEYEAMGIAEYWIVDYRALGAVRYIGKPKQPTVTVCKLIDNEYQMEKHVESDRILSAIFPNLELTTEAILNSVLQ